MNMEKITILKKKRPVSFKEDYVLSLAKNHRNYVFRTLNEAYDFFLSEKRAYIGHVTSLLTGQQFFLEKTWNDFIVTNDKGERLNK